MSVYHSIGYGVEIQKTTTTLYLNDMEQTDVRINGIFNDWEPRCPLCNVSDRILVNASGCAGWNICRFIDGNFVRGAHAFKTKEIHCKSRSE